jgi:hypothetical protein
VKIKSIIVCFCLAWIFPFQSFSQPKNAGIQFDFYGDAIALPYNKASFIDFTDSLSFDAIQKFYGKINIAGFDPLVAALINYKKQYKLDDWLYYQLIRKTAQSISPKSDNYIRYTLYKWFLLGRSGYNTTLSIGDDKLLFYVQSDDIIYDIPYHTRNGKQFVCLNYHDYGGNIDFNKTAFNEVPVYIEQAQQSFTYKISQLPDFKPRDYLEKDLLFNIYQNEYHFRVKLNPQIQTIFANYPAVDYESYFNIPLSRETYQSLIPLLKKNIKGMSKKNGVDYLMRFTRYAFLFETDSENFGKEKRLTPEQTLLFEHSDCEDRAALFFYLVREIYDLPMIVLSYPKHVTIAVHFAEPVGKPIIYNGISYSICEPTPQKQDLRLGELLPDLKNVPYEVVYAYSPK